MKLSDGTVARPGKDGRQKPALIVFCHGSLDLDGIDHLANSLVAEIVHLHVGDFVNLEDTILTVFRTI